MSEPTPGEARLVAEAWSRAASGYDEYWSPRFRPFIEEAVASFRPAPDGPLAVAACGPGVDVVLLAERFPGRSILATDAAPAMVALALAKRNERHLHNVLVTLGRAEELAGSVRQAAGVFSTFALQLLPNPIAALASWSLATRLGGAVVTLFWPPPAPGDPYARLLARLRARVEGKGADAAAPRLPEGWVEATRAAFPDLGLELLEERSMARDIDHPSPEEFLRRVVAHGSLQVAAARHGAPLVEAAGREWLADHGLTRRGNAWIERSVARLWVMRKVKTLHEPH